MYKLYYLHQERIKTAESENVKTLRLLVAEIQRVMTTESLIWSLYNREGIQIDGRPIGGV